MRLIFYNLALFVALVLGSPWWLWRMAATRKYRRGISQRLGKLRPGLADQAEAARRNHQSIVWLHAVSVGEVLAVSRLVEDLDRALPGFRLLISTTTLTGQELARRRFGADRVFYCPLDLPWAVARYLAALQPTLLILAETEFWPNLLSACFRRGIPVSVVNARISDRSFPRYRRLGWFWRPILSRLDRVLAQSELDAERLGAIGCRPDRVTVAGNLKFDVRATSESVTARRLKSAAHGSRFVVAGSTLEGEESGLLEAWPRLLAADPNLCLILAPRHPERFAAVAGLLRSFPFRWTQRSAWPSDTASSPSQLAPSEIILLDSIGELASIYSLAAVAFVGGSLIPAGGHNPLEPAQFGVPIIMGPHYANFRAIVDDLIAHRSIRIIDHQELAAALVELLTNSTEASAMGARGREVFEAQSGATARCIAAIEELLGAAAISERTA